MFKVVRYSKCSEFLFVVCDVLSVALFAMFYFRLSCDVLVMLQY